MPIARAACLAFLIGTALYSFWLHGLRPITPKDFAYKRGTPNDVFAPGRAMVTQRIRRIFPGDAGELLAGMLYGERGLSPDAKQAFRNAGLTHLVAVSGSNVSIIIIGLSRFLSVFRWRRKTVFVILSVALLGFVLFVTPQAPVVRAAIMGWLIALAPIVGRLPKTSHLLLVSATLFTAWQPNSLLFDPSFALSFLATLGLMTYGSRVSSFLDGKMPDVLREALSSTIGATLLTTPYAMWAFGQASAIGLVANLFAVPLVPWIMAVGSLALLIPIAPLKLAANGFLQAALCIAELSMHLPGYWSKLVVSGNFLIFSYLCLAAFWFFLQKKRAYPQKSVRQRSVVKRI